MSIVINPNKQFAEKARLSQHPYKGFPKNVREAFSIAKVHENGIFQIEDGVNPCLYDRCYVFSDINYIDCDEGLFQSGRTVIDGYYDYRDATYLFQ